MWVLKITPASLEIIPRSTLLRSNKYTLIETFYSFSNFLSIFVEHNQSTILL